MKNIKITPELVKQYCQAIGDSNPIHTEDNELGKAIAPGILVTAMISRDPEPYWALAKLNVKYVDAVYVGDTITLDDKIIKAKANFSQVLILTQEELNLETKQTLKKVYSFLGVDQSFVPSNYKNRYNKGGLYKKNLITNFIFGQGHVKELIKKSISIRPWMKNIKNCLVSKFYYSAPKLDRKVEQKLINVFRQDVLKITKLGVNTSLWNNEYFTK